MEKITREHQFFLEMEKIISVLYAKMHAVDIYGIYAYFYWICV
jgi:hypothetical protein